MTAIDVSAMMPAIAAARAEAERLGIPLLDDRILFAYHRAAEPILREQIAQEIEAKRDHYRTKLAVAPRHLRHFEVCAELVRGGDG